MVGVESCYVKTEPNMNSTLIDTLCIGKEVVVKKSTDIDFEQNGVNVSWVEIEYQNNKGTISKGYLWKGNVALGYAKNKGHTFLTTIEKFETTKKDHETIFYVTIKVLDANKKVLDEKTFPKFSGESTYFENKVMGNFGLKHLQNIYRISFNGQACGIPSLLYYFGWNGKNIVALLENQSSADESYYHNEYFIFPKEKGGKPDTIIKVFKEGEAVDEVATKTIYSIEKWKEYYKWNGKKAVFIRKSKVKKYKIKE